MVAPGATQSIWAEFQTDPLPPNGVQSCSGISGGASTCTDTNFNGSNAGDSGIAIGDFFNSVPWSLTITDPLIPFGPEASAGVGPTIAYIPKSDTLCGGLAAAAQVPAAGRSIAFGPLPLGNVNNAKQVLEGGSVFAGMQSENPFIGMQGMANSNGDLVGPTSGFPGASAGVSVSACSDKAAGIIRTVVRLALQNLESFF